MAASIRHIARVIAAIAALSVQQSPAWAQSERLSRQQLDSLIQRLESENLVSVRLNALRRIGEFGTNAAATTPHVEKLLTDSNSMIRAQAAFALGQIGIKAKAAVPGLSALLSDPTQQVRAAAAQALGKIGIANKSAIQRLSKQAESEPHPNVRAFAVWTLGEFARTSTDAFNALLKATKDRSPDVRSTAILALGRSRQKPKTTVPVLIEALADKAYRNSAVSAHLFELTPVAADAADALGEFGPAAKQSEPALRAAMIKARPMEVRLAAARAIIQISKPDGDVRKVLFSAARHKNETVRAFAIMTLGSLKGRKSAETITAIRKSLSDDSPVVRSAAARAIPKLGSDAGSFLPQLKRLQTDEFSFVRDSARKAIEDIGRQKKAVK